LKGEWAVKAKNYPAYQYLKEAGIKVYYDDAVQYTHSKILVIDEQKPLR